MCLRRSRDLRGIQGHGTGLSTSANAMASSYFMSIGRDVTTTGWYHSDHWYGPSDSASTTAMMYPSILVLRELLTSPVRHDEYQLENHVVRSRKLVWLSASIMLP